MNEKYDAIDLADVLRQLASAIEAMTANDLKEFLEGLKSGKRITRTALDPNTSKAKRNSVIGRQAVSDILGRLQGAQSTEEGFKLLRELHLTRRDLVEIARERSVHIIKEDSVHRIEEKLVEAIIGSRLNSQAIRGTGQSS